MVLHNHQRDRFIAGCTAGSHIINYTFPLFQLQKCTELKNLLAQANNRYVLFDNRAQLSEEKKSQQVDELLAKVRQVVAENGGNFFRHKLMAEVHGSMIGMVKAELKAMERDPALADLYSKVAKSPRPKPRLLDAQIAGESSAGQGNGKSTANLHESLKVLKEKKQVTQRVERLESGNPADPQLSQEDIASKFTLKSPQGAANTRRKAPADAGRPEKPPVPPKPQTTATGRAHVPKGTGPKAAEELVQRVEGPPKPAATPDNEGPPKPSRKQVDEAAEDEETKQARERIQKIEVQSQQETRSAGDDGTSIPASFVYEVQDRPGMRMSQKQRMVEEALKRKIAKGTEELNEEQKEELEKISKSLGEKIREGMSKLALKTIGQCRLM